MNLWIYRRLGWVAVLFFLTACNGKATTNAPLATQPVSVTPAPTLTQSFTETPIAPALSPTPANTATVTPKPDSEIVTRETTIVFVSENIPDGTQLEQGQVFTKTWTIRNGGAMLWKGAYDLSLISSNPANENLGSPDSIPLLREVKPGEETSITVNLTAPSQDGLYTVAYQLRNERGELIFGSELWVTIRVGDAPVISSITVGNVSATLVGATVLGDEISVNFCMQMPDGRAWYPWEVALIIDQQHLSPTGSRIDPATATTAYKCFSFSYPVSASFTSGDSYQLSIGKVELPPEVHQAENCAYAKQVLTAAYPGLDFICGSPGIWYTNLVTPPGMTVEKADRLILDAMSSSIYGPWNFNGRIP